MGKRREKNLARLRKMSKCKFKITAALPRDYVLTCTKAHSHFRFTLWPGIDQSEVAWRMKKDSLIVWVPRRLFGSKPQKKRRR